VTPTDEIASAITSNPGMSDHEISRSLKVNRHLVGDIRAALGIESTFHDSRVSVELLKTWTESDADLARHCGVTRSRISQLRRFHGIASAHVPEQSSRISTCLPKSTRTAVEALASAEGVTMSSWCAAAIVERMERERLVPVDTCT
jgi:hypothetical protein